MSISDLDPIYPLADCVQPDGYLPCSEAWLRSKLRDRTFAGIKIAGRWYMRESQLMAAATAMSTEAREIRTSPAGLPQQSRFRRRVHRQAS